MSKKKEVFWDINYHSRVAKKSINVWRQKSGERIRMIRRLLRGVDAEITQQPCRNVPKCTELEHFLLRLQPDDYSDSHFQNTRLMH